jgi:hypothetical protein
MSIEIEVVNGAQSRPQAEKLFQQMEPHDARKGEKGDANEPDWARVTWADPDLRVMIEDPDSGLVRHLLQNDHLERPEGACRWRRPGRDPSRLPPPRLRQHRIGSRRPDHAPP